MVCVFEVRAHSDRRDIAEALATFASLIRPLQTLNCQICGDLADEAPSDREPGLDRTRPRVRA